MRKYFTFFLIAGICVLLFPFNGFAQLSPSIPEWVNDIGGSNSSSVVSLEKIDKQNNIYITGIFSGTVDFDPLPSGVKNLTSSGNSVDVYVAKYDTNSVLI